MLSRFNQLKKRLESDITQLTDEELKNIYEECKLAKSYYDDLQLVVKLCANALYGACGSEFFRFFNTTIASDITQEGKFFMILVYLINLI